MPEIIDESNGAANHQPTDSSNRLLADSIASSKSGDQTQYVRFYVEEDQSGQLMLPAVDGKPPSKAMKPLREAFDAMLDGEKLDFKQTGTKSDANLIITSQSRPSSNAAAFIDMPGGKHRIIFNSAQIFDRTTFEATAAHAFEKSFGYPKTQYLSIPNDPYFRK